jgi:hypothetical protein
MILKGQAKPSFNAVVLATREEADDAGRELMSRWFVPTGWAVVESDEPVNYKFDWDNGLQSIAN